MEMRIRSNRRRANGNGIRGPHSALTDFLASQNISADQIRRNFLERQELANAERQQSGSEQQPQQSQSQQRGQEAPAQNGQNQQEATARTRKRKCDEEKAIAKIKKSKAFQQRTTRSTGKDAVTIEDEIAQQMYRSVAVPGQFDNCAVCEKRFTVTSYTKAGPDGGLLCPRCAKELDDDEKAKQKKKPMPNRHRQRQMRSDLLDGVATKGALSLVRLCLKKVAEEIDDVEEFGDLSPLVLDQLSRILSKRRVIDSRTMNLFLRPEYDQVTIYDAAKLQTADFKKIFAVCPKIESLYLTHANQFKDEVLDYVTGHPDVALLRFRLEGANLIKDEVWRRFFAAKGGKLESVQLSCMDGHFDDETFAVLVRASRRLIRLKFDRLWKLTGTSMENMGDIKSLRQLTWSRPFADILSSSVAKMLEKIGSDLETLCLDKFSALDDDVFASIHNSCHRLRKLRITENSRLTDNGFVGLFTDWSNPALRYISFRYCRDVNPNDATENKEGIGLCSDGFKALMKHSGARLERLHMTSCRHVSYEAFSTVFDGQQTYPHLRSIDVSFCSAVNDVIVAAIFKSCPNLKSIWAFGCFDVGDVVVPPGVILTGRVSAEGELAIRGGGNGEGDV